MENIVENKEKCCIAHFTRISECGIYNMHLQNKIGYSDQQSISKVSPEGKVKNKKKENFKTQILNPSISKLDDKKLSVLGGGLTRFLPLFAAAALADLLQ